MKLPQLLILLAVALSSTEARPKSSLAPLPKKHHAFLHEAALTSQTSINDAQAVRGGGGGEATMTNEMFNMVKAVVGVGVLSLPAGEFYVDVTNDVSDLMGSMLKHVMFL